MSLPLLMVEMIVLIVLLVSRSNCYRDIMEEDAFSGMAYDDIVMLLEGKNHFNPAAAFVDICWRIFFKPSEGSS